MPPAYPDAVKPTYTPTYSQSQYPTIYTPYNCCNLPRLMMAKMVQEFFFQLGVTNPSS